jgi:predicted nucleic acid-binding protein
MTVPVRFRRSRIFIDTGPLVAVYDASDSFHSSAIQFRDEVLLRTQVEMFCSIYVVAETLNNLQRLVQSGQIRKADFESAARGITDDAPFQNLPADEGTVRRALEIIDGFPFFSFTDATNLALMERGGIRNIFSFDSDFDRYSIKSGHQKVYLARHPSSWQILD